MEDKNNLRIYAKNLRKTLKIDAISEKLVDLVRKNHVYKNSQNVMLFYPAKHEIDLKELLKDNKNFYLPRVCAKDLEVCPYKCGDKLAKSDIGILEPICNPIKAAVLDLVIVPALMCDRHGYRLGYGGGFYDRFLAKIPQVKTLVVIPKELLIDKLPFNEHDIKIDNIIYV